MVFFSHLRQQAEDASLSPATARRRSVMARELSPSFQSPQSGDGQSIECGAIVSTMIITELRRESRAARVVAFGLWISKATIEG
jgi:hypothetical protein